MLRTPARLSGLLLLVLLVAAGGRAAAQHPLPPSVRPLHERIAAADVVAVGTIGPIGEGRIEVRDAVVLRGAAPAQFEIKRSPATPPPFVTGVPAVLLLRGARPPYVLVDEPREVVLPSNANAAQRWTEALRALFVAGDDPEKLLHTYLVWLDGEDESLREAAAAALSDVRAPFLPLGARDAVLRAQAAMDPRRAPAARRISAMLAMSHPDGGAALVAAIPGAAPDPQVVATAIRASIAAPPAQREAALLRALAHDDEQVRRAALAVAYSAWSDAVAARVAALEHADPAEAVRLEARDARTRAAVP
ncbi:MAG: hypothetical protein DCC71_17035 [Proteobacteria bacterium]|nr:MAG: hypothetical protein DCC71_17035 [Pseudomonadota bacterium]